MPAYSAQACGTAECAYTVELLDRRSEHCSAGYIYDFPFLAGTDFVTVEDNRVGPLYQHIFPPAAAPTLAFVGIPWKVPSSVLTFFRAFVFPATLKPRPGLPAWLVHCR